MYLTRQHAFCQLPSLLPNAFEMNERGGFRMEILDKESVQRLASVTQGPCVSLYMPTTRTTPDARQDQIRMKNLSREAAQTLVGQGVAPAASL